MKKLFLIFFILGAFTSCKNHSGNEIGNTNVVGYGLINEELEVLNAHLTKQIKYEMADGHTEWQNSDAIYDSLTSEYVSFLDNILNTLLDNVDYKSPIKYTGSFSKSEFVNDYFFEELDYNQRAEEFIRKTNQYRTEILKLVEDEYLANKIELILHTHNPQMRNGEIIKYLNYYYMDKPLINVLAYLNHKKKSVLEFQLEYLKNRKEKPAANNTYSK